MNTGNRAYSYATALFEATCERMIQSLRATAQLLESKPALLEKLGAVDTKFETRKASLDSLLAAAIDPLARNLLYTLLQRGDLGLLPEVIASLNDRVSQVEAGPTPVEVVTAIPLGDDQRKKLETKLASQYGTNLVCSYRVDAAILGGIIVRGDKLIDGSVATRLAAMKQSLGGHDTISGR
jgi:F-type H+-transporting ATPase subunit delta